jgi:hypothetical protein
MVVAVCPQEDTVEETACTLQFASRVRGISLQGAEVGDVFSLSDAFRATR